MNIPHILVITKMALIIYSLKFTCQ